MTRDILELDVAVLVGRRGELLDLVDLRRSCDHGVTLRLDFYSVDDLTQIVDIQLGRLRKLLAERGLSLELTEAAKLHLAEAGWDPVYGARPLKRAIQRELQDPLALKILQGEFHDCQTVQVDVDSGALTFAPVVEGEVVDA